MYIRTYMPKECIGIARIDSILAGEIYPVVERESS